MRSAIVRYAALFLFLSVSGGVGCSHAPGSNEGGLKDSRPASLIRVVMWPEGVQFADPVTIQWQQVADVPAAAVHSHTFTAQDQQLALDAHLTSLQALPSADFFVLGWDGPCVLSDKSGLDDFSVCALREFPASPQEYTVWVTPKMRNGWTLERMHLPVDSSNYSAISIFTAGAIDNAGAVALAGSNHSVGAFPTVILGNQHTGKRDWNVLYTSPNPRSGLFAIQKLLLAGTSNAPSLVECQVIALAHSNEIGYSDAQCLSANGKNRVVGPIGLSDFALANPTTNPALWTAQHSSVFISSSPELEKGTWSEVDLQKKIPGLPPIEIAALSISNYGPWIIGSYGALIRHNPNTREWMVDYPRLPMGTSLIGVQALPDGSAWLTGSGGTILEVSLNGIYQDRSTPACGGVPLALVAHHSDDVWMASATGICQWDGHEWHDSLFGLYPHQPTMVALSPDGKQLLALSATGFVATRELK